jgi:hypothetical protein
VTTTTCTITYTYSAVASAIARDARAEAIAEIRGRRTVVATGRLRNRKLKLTFPRLRRGRYRLTLLELRADRAPLVIGHTSLVISSPRWELRLAVPAAVSRLRHYPSGGVSGTAPGGEPLVPE